MVRPVHRRFTATVAALLLSVRICGGAEPTTLLSYHPNQICHGVIRSWSHGFLRPMMKLGEDGFQQVVDRVGTDRFGIGLAGAGYRNPQAKLVALAANEAGPFVAATPETIVNQTYPLARPVRFYLNRGAAIPADPKMIEFLRFVLSREGQQAVARDGKYLPLTAEVVNEDLAKLQ